MPEHVYLFLDFDDTLSDMAVFRLQLARELASLLSSEFGGTAEEWFAVLPACLEASIRRYHSQFVGRSPEGFNAWIADERERVAREVFQAKGVALPDDVDVAALAVRLQFGAITACNANFPNVEHALRDLSEDGVHINLASSQESEYLFAGLLGAGIESYVDAKFGPDLVDFAKEGPEYYRRIFAACDISPSQAIVVDDQAECLDWAEETGARVIQARVKPGLPEPEFPMVLNDFSELPGLVRQLSA